MKIEDLLPCPFCGARYKEPIVDHWEDSSRYAYHPGGACDGFGIAIDLTDEIETSMWNRRDA